MIEPVVTRMKKRASAATAAAGSASFASLLAAALIGPADAAFGDESTAPDAGQAPAAGLDPCAMPAEPQEVEPADADCPPPDPSGGEPEPAPETTPDEDPEPEPDENPEPEPDENPEPEPDENPEPPPPPPPSGGRDAGVAHYIAPDRHGHGHGHGHGHAAPDGGDADRDHGGTPRDHANSGSGGASAGAAPTSGYPFTGVPTVVTPESPIPSFLLPIFEECGRRYGIPWRVLAAINQVETAFGSNLNVSSAGAVGWMQFLPSTWRAYGVDGDGDGRRDPYNPDDAICAAGNYLRAAGAHRDLRGAIFAYNHAGWYVEMVLATARSYAGISALDPLPPAKRLDRDFALELARIARHEHVDWAVVLATLRASGGTGRTPATAEQVREVADRVARSNRRTAGSKLTTGARQLFGGRVRLRPEIAVLARYNRAIGLRGLVHGLNAVRDQLQARALESPVLQIYAGGRQDIADGRVDPRILTMLLYLAESHDELVVTSLITGHGYYARPGVPSAHAFGEAVDIAAVDGASLLGNQRPGTVAERTVREILTLPRELQPAQVISLFELGGPSFAAADHHDHIHVGF